jgi:Protein phosphatase 2C
MASHPDDAPSSSPFPTGNRDWTMPLYSLRVFGASVTGPLHVREGKPCQDAFAYEVSEGGRGVVAVADGLGSAARSDLGSRAAVDAAVRAVSYLASNEDSPLPQLAREGVSAARAELERTAGQEGCPLRDLACTLLVVVLRDGRAAAAHVGDGAVVASTADGLRMLSAPGDSEYANEVVPLTSIDWSGALRTSAILDGVRGILAFTDGCQRAALRKTRDGYFAFEGFCGPLLSYAAGVVDPAAGERDLEGLLLSAKLSEHSEDDKTLVLATVHTSEEGQQV